MEEASELLAKSATELQEAKWAYDRALYAADMQRAIYEKAWKAHYTLQKAFEQKKSA